ncbi:hypothetical protein ACLKMH_19785 [Psychromonas sp. KJ10-10]|uniref:hypothetical protein n=1 Tax=Psychromonas sp. KJ10-10 TaxID=3391823 RepID=UPI0039B67C8F
MESNIVDKASFDASQREEKQEITQQDYVQLHKQITRLTSSQEQFLALYEHAPVSYLVLSQEFKIIDANTQARRILNLTDTAVLNEKILLPILLKGWLIF